jgi:hypothetical protein
MKEVSEKTLVDSKSMLDRKTRLDQPLLSTHDIDQYMVWTEEEFTILLKETPCQRFMLFLGGGCGAITSLMSSRIAYEFGASLTEVIPPPILGSVFGCITGLTVGSALVFVGSDIFKDWVKKVPPSKKVLIGGCSVFRIVGGLYTCVVIGVGLISSLDITYLMDSVYSGELGKATFLFDIPAFLTTFAISNWSLGMQLSNLYNFLRRNSAPYMCQYLCDRIEMELFLERFLNSVLAGLNGLPENQIESLYTSLFENSDLEENAGAKVNKLFALGSVRQSTFATPKPPESACNKFFGFVGTIVGAVAPYFTLAITQDAGKWVCNLVNITDEKSIYNFSQFLGWSAFITASALSAYTAKIGFARIQSTLAGTSRKDCKALMDRTTGIKLVLAGLSTSYRLKLTLDVLKDSGAWKIPVGICSVLGPFSTYYWGLDVVKYKLKGVSKREQLQNMVTQMIEQLPELEYRYISALYHYIKRPNTAQPLLIMDKIDSKSKNSQSESRDRTPEVNLPSPVFTPQFQSNKVHNENQEKQDLKPDAPLKSRPVNTPAPASEKKGWSCSIM